MLDVRLLCLLALTCGMPLPSAADASPDAQIQLSREMAKELMTSLKQRLQQAMRSGGPLAAVETCQLEAGVITAGVAQSEDWSIRRTSLKVRNPDNAPDRWERVVLEQFESRRASGQAPGKLEHYEVVEEQGKKVFRWMKAIPTGEVCVTCHGGATVGADLEAVINRLYPQDQARGFKPGDIRGAFSVRGPAD